MGSSSGHWDSRSEWRSRAMWRGHLLQQAREQLAQVQEQLTQSLMDYDVVERELRTWLSYEDGHPVNKNLLAMSHEDLAHLADDYRRKYLALLEGEQQHGLA